MPYAVRKIKNSSNSNLVSGNIVFRKSVNFCLKTKVENFGKINEFYELHDKVEQPVSPSNLLGLFTENSGYISS